MDLVWSVGLRWISLAIELTDILLFNCVQLTNSIELSPWIDFDCVRLSLNTERSIGYAGYNELRQLSGSVAWNSSLQRLFIS